MGFSDAQMGGRRERWRDGWMRSGSAVGRRRSEPLHLKSALLFQRSGEEM